MKNLQKIGYVIISIILIIILFLLLEFTDNNGCALSFLSGTVKNTTSKFTIPDSIQVWLNGELTFAGAITLLCCLGAFLLFFIHFINWGRAIEHQNRRGHNLRLLGSTMLLLWTIGWNLYLQAFLFFDDHQFVNAELLLRSAIASMDLFMLDIDSNILDQIAGHPHLKGALAFVSVLSFVCTVALLISLVSARLWAHLKLSCCSTVNHNHSHLYIFFGIDQQTELLAGSIRNNDSKSIRIFIEKVLSDEDDGKEGWSHLLAMLTHRREAFKKVKDLDARLSLTDCSINNIKNSSEEFDVFDEAGLDNVKNKIRKLGCVGENAELHLFFLSENEDNNIESVAVIVKDLTINQVARNGVKVIAYCHTRLNSVTRVIEHSSLDKTIEVRIVDSAHLAIEELKKKESIALQPVNFVKIEDDGTTSSEFNALVIGFNEVGQDAVRFLYEYGAFVYSDKSKGISRSPFCCHVIDPNMKDIAPHYMDTHLRTSYTQNGKQQTLITLDQEETALVNLHSFGYKDQAFFDLFDKICDSLNYIVIAIGDDIEEAKLAVWLLKHAMRKKKDLRNFKILLRSYSQEKIPHVDKIVKYYNGIFYAEMVNKSTDKPEKEQDNDHEIIHVFGKPEQIYSYQSIVSNEIRRESWQYYNSYYDVEEKTDSDFARLTDEQKASGHFCSASQPDYAWNIRRQKELETKIFGSPMYSSIMSVRRKESQDMENALHRHSKRIVALKALGDEPMLHRIESGIRHKTITRDDITNRYFENKVEQKSLNTLMTTLAQMEHLRWNASHEMLGYVWGENKDEASSEHDCLTSWEELSTDKIRGYDYEVVDRSFKLADEETERRK